MYNLRRESLGHGTLIILVYGKGILDVISNPTTYVFAGNGVVPHQLHVDTSRMDRVGLPEDEREESAVDGDDKRSTRLSHVASLWKGNSQF